MGVSVAILNGMVREGQAESLHAWGGCQEWGTAGPWEGVLGM